MKVIEKADMAFREQPQMVLDLGPTHSKLHKFKNNFLNIYKSNFYDLFKKKKSLYPLLFKVIKLDNLKEKLPVNSP